MKRLRILGRIILGILREISDESAYKRHLVAHEAQHSGVVWAGRAVAGLQDFKGDFQFAGPTLDEIV